MSVARFLAGVFGPSLSQDDPNAWRLWGYGAAARTDAGVFVSERLALNLAGVQCVVRIIADALAALPAATERLEERTSKWTAVDDDPREYMLNVQPNEYMTPIVARKAWHSTALLWGNGYGEIERNGRGQGAGFWPLPAGSIAPRLDYTSGSPRLRYYGTVGGKPFDRDPSEVMHLRGMTLCGYVGLSPIAEARQAVGLGMAAEQFGAKLFGRDLRSGGWINGAKEKGENLANLREYVNAQGGLEHAHLVKILGEGMTFVPGTIPPEDAQFLGTREFALADICRMFGVPLELVMAQGKTSSWGSGIEQLLLAFVQFTLSPWATQAEQELSLKLLTSTELAAGMRIRFKIREILRGDSGARSAFYERMTRMRTMTRNEVRIEEGRNPVSGGDEFDEPQAPGGSFGGSTPPDPREQERDRERKQESDQ